MSKFAHARRTPTFDSDRRATVRLGGGCALFGEVVALGRDGALVEFPREIPVRVGRWVVLVGPGPLEAGYDARVVAAEDHCWHLEFDPTIVALGIFDDHAAGPRAAVARRPAVAPTAEAPQSTGAGGATVASGWLLRARAAATKPLAFMSSTKRRR